MELVSTTKKMLETQQLAVVEETMYKPYEFIEPLDHTDNARIEQAQHPWDVHTLTLFLTSCRGLTC